MERVMSEEKEVAGFKHIAKVPEGGFITGLVSHKGKIYISTKTNLYVVIDDSRLEKVELKWIDDE
jgi:hypothetical protein